MRTRHEKHRSGIEKPWTHQGGWRGKGFRRHAKLGPLLSPSIDRLAKQGASGKGGEQRSSPLTRDTARREQQTAELPPSRAVRVSASLGDGHRGRQIFAPDAGTLTRRDRTGGREPRGLPPSGLSRPRWWGVAPRRRTENRAARLTPPVHGTAHVAYHLA